MVIDIKAGGNGAVGARALAAAVAITTLLAIAAAADGENPAYYLTRSSAWEGKARLGAS